MATTNRVVFRSAEEMQTEKNRETDKQTEGQTDYGAKLASHLLLQKQRGSRRVRDVPDIEP